MGLAGSRTSFSFPPNRKPSFLSAIFCICHHVCPLVHPILPVTAFGWQFLYRGCIFVVTVFLLSNFSGFAALWDDTPHMTCGGLRGTAPRVIAFRTKTALKSEKHTIGWYHVNNSGKGINRGYVEDFRYNEEFLAKCAPPKEEVLETVESIRNEDLDGYESWPLYMKPVAAVGDWYDLRRAKERGSDCLKDEAYTIYANALPRAFEKWCGYPAGSIYSTSDYYGNTSIFCDIQ